MSFRRIVLPAKELDIAKYLFHKQETELQKRLLTRLDPF